MELRIDGYIGQESGLASLLGDGSSFNLSKLENTLDANKDKALHIKINSGGGSVTEGFAIHDRIASSGLEVTTEVLGMCGSIATIIALSAKKGNRKGHKNSEYFIHNPFWQPTAPDAMEADDLSRLSGELKSAEERILNFYVEKTGADKETLRALMAAKTSLTMQQAKDLGFIDEIIGAEVNAEKRYAILAYIEKPNMKEFTNEQKTWLDKKLANIENLFKKVIKNEGVQAMMVELADGNSVFVESEDGEFVGKKVFTSDKTTPAPDGNHQLKDGRTLVVKGGVVESVTEAVSNEAKQAAEIATLTQNLKDANDKLAAFEAEKTANAEAMQSLKKELDEVKNFVIGATPKAAAQNFKQTDFAPVTGFDRIKSNLNKFQNNLKNQ